MRMYYHVYYHLHNYKNINNSFYLFIVNLLYWQINHDKNRIKVISFLIAWIKPASHKINL